MGRIKTQLIKRISIELYNNHRDQLKNNFEDNKKIVGELLDIQSKKLRNVISGYITRLVRKE